MSEVRVAIDTGRGLIDVNIHRGRGSLWSLQPKLQVYVRNDGEIHRASESKKDIDVFLAFRSSTCLEEFAKHEQLVHEKGLSVRTFSLPTIADSINKETLVVLDPKWKNELDYDDYFIITFHSFRRGST